ncbi:uncharacterized protein LOC118182229 isoform X2 [Stegodyphus dumicola]|uniref:uncharacterized protein LOC118182229 isoform X2 n=1 Tax=Stegodyphus dumicola TaxID=202533 RepID=UPI0015A8EC87|nr:uncharacterized protein LOC118182229 isoform X2 [Stegodyphus dumicola]
MNFILVFLLIILGLMDLGAEKVILPDGRIFVIPDIESYKYILHNESPSSLELFYILQETQSKSAVLCPKGYFIIEINQELVVNQGVTLSEPDITLKHKASLLQPELSESHRTAPCPTIYDCLGYQACLFKFSNEFCQRDPVWSVRKIVLLTVVCMRDDMHIVPSQFQKQKNFVLHILYKLENDEAGITEQKDYSLVNIQHVELPEDLVFSGQCSLPQTATQIEGYFGKCDEVPLPNEDIAVKMWTILGRTKSKNCAEELKQVFCAFQYNKQGLCIPPMYHNNKTEKNQKISRMYNFHALPNPGYRRNVLRYKHFLSEHHSEVVPARLAFLIMCHESVPAIIELLHSIYREQYLYLIHVDKQATEIREELLYMLSVSHFNAKNIFVLPPEQSFTSSWASYAIVRAELEGFEELLRLGLWDFVINLSGSDLPLRSVDDLAIALAPHRGLSFLPFIHSVNKEGNKSAFPNANVYYACDEYVYDVTSVPNIPSEDKLEIYSSSQWGVFSREFIEYLVNEKLRHPLINKYQFYLQTRIIPDESYIPTVLMNSPFRNTLHLSPMHTTKEFSFVDADNLCRHIFIDADFCGQGPGLFSAEDIPTLYSLSHRSFFARKFNLQPYDTVRKAALDLAQNYYHHFLEKFLPASVVKAVIEDAIAKYSHAKKLEQGQLVFESVLNLQITPSLVPHDPCCRSKLVEGLQAITDYNYWLDISVFDKGDERLKNVRIILEPALSSRFCYPHGDLRMAFISPWISDNQTYSEGFDFTQSLPLPYAPAFSDGVFIIVLIARETESLDCRDGFVGDPLYFSDRKSPVKVMLKLISPDQNIRCVKNETLYLEDYIENKNLSASSMNLETEEETFWKIYPITIKCGTMEPGHWMLQITQVQPSNSVVYNFPFYLLDFHNEYSLNDHLHDVVTLWQLKHFSFISNDYTFNFEEDEEIEKQILFSRENYLIPKLSKIKKSNYIHKKEESRKINMSEKNSSNLKMSHDWNIKQVITIGVNASYIILCIILIYLFRNRRYHFHQKVFYFFLSCLICVIIHQLLMFILFSI